MRIIWSICLLCFLMACSENKLSKLDFLIGTWKTENKENYEQWEKNENNSFVGSSYKMENGQKVIWENLSIKLLGDEIFYEATVADQNEGKTIQFSLNEETKSYFSFENEKHDFPKKIQYKIVSNDKVEVTVLGNKDEGFSYFQIRQ